MISFPLFIPLNETSVIVLYTLQNLYINIYMFIYSSLTKFYVSISSVLLLHFSLCNLDVFVIVPLLACVWPHIFHNSRKSRGRERERKSSNLVVPLINSDSASYHNAVKPFVFCPRANLYLECNRNERWLYYK